MQNEKKLHYKFWPSSSLSVQYLLRRTQKTNGEYI